MNLNYYFKNFPIIETNRLILREIKQEDLDDLARCVSDPEMYKYWGSNIATAEKNIEDFYRRYLDRNKRDREDINWGIALKENNKIIGQIFINNIENKRMAHVSYRITKDYWNNGYATEALNAVIDFCFTKTELKRIWTNVDIRNVSSCKVLEKCKFTKEGNIRQGKMGMTYCDYFIYGIIESDLKY